MEAVLFLLCSLLDCYFHCRQRCNRLYHCSKKRVIKKWNKIIGATLYSTSGKRLCVYVFIFLLIGPENLLLIKRKHSN